ncbi:isocitrate lyase/phosphoenolpyruvate mutase family protein [Nocardiopsis sp. RSe5-2]|uniref:Isocitrate lyase/phosphoenolpyruvate mutase family protein n=1 Tax=Nocardiopsis endophytica TaxID=3018445 RepID=A0ABT4TZJ4_9ACTN|nr:isocitrate lyase/phosphoenolpyruvate mutase family protein [Nocardiopsis endophytica]MDA2809841.1 isocitrate lyase/phosphoenolpyruvate mutase family protein [Nocardiopsis endophytica]
MLNDVTPDDPTRSEKAERLRELHRPGDPLVLVNAWDAASARVVAATPGAKAVATASHSVAAAYGVRDGENLPFAELEGVVRRVCGAVSLPVTVDMERGYGADADGVAESLGRLVAAGAVGCNIEDGLGDDGGAEALRPVDEQAERLRAARAAAEAAGVPVVVNARTDALAHGLPVEEAVRRGRAYLDAGADCVFVLGAASVPVVERLVAELGPVSVLAGADGPSLDELAEAGVARISMGPGPMGAAYAALRRLADDAANRRPLPADLSYRP